MASGNSSKSAKPHFGVEGQSDSASNRRPKPQHGVDQQPPGPKGNKPRFGTEGQQGDSGRAKPATVPDLAD